MKKRLLKYLACPQCRASLQISEANKTTDTEIINGVLTCPSGHVYPIQNTVPQLTRITNEAVTQISDIYSEQWKEVTDESEETWPGLNPEKRITRFMKAFNITPTDLKGKTILDAGCGNGRLAHNIAEKGAEVIALDISTSVHTAAQKFSNKNLHYIQGDLSQPPLRPQLFDYIWCSGVIHYNPHPKNIFDALASLVNNNGKLYVWVYMKPSPNLKYRILWGLVELLQKTPSPLQKTLSTSYVLLQTITHPNRWKNKNQEFIKQQQRIVRNFTTPIIHRYTQNEITNWFKNHGFTNIQIPIKDYATFSGFGICGIKTTSQDAETL